MVTQADLESEEYLKLELGKLVPEAAFWAEESGKSGDAEYHWVIDPLDGTTNFARGLPYFCISVALTKNNKPILGAIYQPVTEELFIAAQGLGAFCNGVRLDITALNSIHASVPVVIGLPFAYVDYYQTVVQKFKKMTRKHCVVRSSGAAALDSAYAAAGSIDIVFFEKLGWWDIAAGVILITEAGGIISDFSGKPITPESTRYIGGSKSTYETFYQLIKKP
ncbi:inositol monophosphatase [Candidatus Dependentiae bacterium Noda2021]|nr:inositol monophosphatase [Candidatus Dependentiae bacterium Noda2021]